MSRRRPSARSAGRLSALAALVALAALAAQCAMVTGPAAAAGSVDADEPAPRATSVALALEVAADGRGPFTPDDQPGGDSGPANGLTRTGDTITYRVTVNATGGTARDERFVIDAPSGTTWEAVPLACAPGSLIDGQRLTCRLGDVTEGHATAVPVALTLSGDLRHGDHVTVSGTASAEGVESTPAVQAPVTTVSAAPRYNLSKKVVGSVLRTDVPGPDGSPGVQLVYPMTVDWLPVVPGQGLLGFERSSGDMSFTDDVSRLLGDRPSGAVLWNGGRPVCGRNGEDGVAFGGLPGGRGGGSGSVADSGQISCAQGAAGQPVTVTISGAVTDAGRMPTRNLAGGPISGGAKPYVVSGWISFWMPTPEAPTSVDSVNTFTPLQTTSSAGTPNFPGGAEPLEDNEARRNLVELASGSAGKRLWRLGYDGRTTTAGSAKEGDPWATGGTLLRSDVAVSNPGLRPFVDTVLCDTFDRRTQRLTAVSGRSPAWSSGLEHARVQYAAYAMHEPADGQRRTCDDADGPWFDDPAAVPGGAAAVGAVRVTGDVRGGGNGALYTTVTTLRSPDGTRAYDFAHVHFGDHRPGWVHDQQDPVLGAGGLADSVVLTEDLARVTKAVVDPGSNAEDTPDTTATVLAGNTVDFVLRPTLTNGLADGRPTAMTVRDVLPGHTSFVPDSASLTPVVDTVTAEDGSTRQRLTWTLDDVTPGERIAPITYSAVVEQGAPAGSITNSVVVSAPTDRSDERWRTAERGLRVVTTGGVGVEKTALAPIVVAGDAVEWDLRATNTDDTDLRDLDVIDVLPHRGDPYGTAFHGSVELAQPVAVDADAGESVRYTHRAAEDVALDGADPSNQPHGATRWCAETEFGTSGCPDGWSEVTALRILRSSPVASGATVSHRVSLATHGSRDGDRYGNRFGLRASNLALPVQSNPSTVRVVAGAIGDRVWSDRNGDGLQDDDEPGLAGVPVAITGQDDRGTPVDQRGTTGEDGDYRFDGLRPGAYRVHVTVPEGLRPTIRHAGDEAALDSDVDEDGTTDPVELTRRSEPGEGLVGVTHDVTIDAGFVAENGDGSDGGDGGDPDAGVGVPDTGGQGTGSGTGSGSDSDSGPGPTAGQDDGASRISGSRLAFTGAEIGTAAVVGLGLLLAGLTVLFRRRRIQRASDRG
ncbi:hypothetical protein HP467_17505 [Curtobacterium albidum]|uniref:SD-repeat containing protein B domain-containing protein n=1 Tax=Curtobacterium citreum TaxID=2036 RepID=A0A850E0B2_9MICO|nr:SdrD B-like domain-containing protein [Curtobacterium albidum]NUU29890.1 hypothetical protein [Curtobacterium albidum]